MGRVFGAVAAMAGLRRAKASVEDVARHQWRDSTQRMGLRFTERVRDAWRGRWLKLHRRPERGERDDG